MLLILKKQTHKNWFYYMKGVQNVIPHIYYHGNYNNQKECNNIVGLNKFSATKQYFPTLSLLLSMDFYQQWTRALYYQLEISVTKNKFLCYTNRKSVLRATKSYFQFFNWNLQLSPEISLDKVLIQSRMIFTKILHFSLSG